MAVVDCDPANEEKNDEEGAVQGEIMIAELLGGKSYTCPALIPCKRRRKGQN